MYFKTNFDIWTPQLYYISIKCKLSVHRVCVNQGWVPILPHHESPTSKNLCYIFYSVWTSDVQVLFNVMYVHISLGL